MNVEQLWSALRIALETHGWTLLAVTALLLLARTKYREYAQRAHIARTLAAANDPERVAVLQRETARIREAQQQQLAQSTTRSSSSAKTKPFSKLS